MQRVVAARQIIKSMRRVTINAVVEEYVPRCRYYGNCRERHIGADRSTRSVTPTATGATRLR